MAELNFKNRTLYHGDNLDFLRGMNSETVHLIATDPPFNKNRDFHATPDSLAAGARFKDRWRWDEDVHEEWTDSIIDDFPAVWEVITAARAAYGDDMGAFLCWLGVRLMEMRRVLRADGSIYLHIDHTAHAYVKCLMDAIFGRKQFQNEIVWKRTVTVKGDPSRRLANDTDFLLFYSKSKQYVWNVDAITMPYNLNNLDEKTLKQYRNRDTETGRLWRFTEITDPHQNPNSNCHYEVMGVTRTWRWTRDRMELEIARGRVIQTKPGNVPRFKRYLDEQKGRKLNNLWVDVPNLTGTNAERTGYPTQKPLALYERIIKASSNKGDIVLDPFCGCATTPIAAERLGRQWVGMDIWDEAYKQVMGRMQRDTVLRFDDTSHVTLPQVQYTSNPPARTDENEVAAPALRLKIRRSSEPWQKISHKGMMNILVAAQATSGGVICAGCGRVLEREFMQLDHITPKSDRGENHILNRILLCGPCNRRKRDNLTLRGLLRENKKKAVQWMKDEDRAKLAQAAARERAEWTRDNMATEACQALIALGETHI